MAFRGVRIFESVLRSYDHTQFVAKLPTGLSKKPHDGRDLQEIVKHRYDFTEMSMPLPVGKVDFGHVRFSREYDLAMWYVGRTPQKAER